MSIATTAPVWVLLGLLAAAPARAAAEEPAPPPFRLVGLAPAGTLRGAAALDAGRLDALSRTPGTSNRRTAGLPAPVLPPPGRAAGHGPGFARVTRRTAAETLADQDAVVRPAADPVSGARRVALAGTSGLGSRRPLTLAPVPGGHRVGISPQPTPGLARLRLQPGRFQCLAGGRSFDDPGRYQGIDSSQYSFSLDLLGSLYGFGCFCLGLLNLALSCPAHRFNLGESGVFLRQRFGFHLFGM